MIGHVEALVLEAWGSGVRIDSPDSSDEKALSLLSILERARAIDGAGDRGPDPDATHLAEWARLARAERRIAYIHAAEVVTNTFPTSDAVERLRQLAEDGFARHWQAARQFGPLPGNSSRREP